MRLGGIGGRRESRRWVRLVVSRVGIRRWARLVMSRNRSEKMGKDGGIKGWDQEMGEVGDAGGGLRAGHWANKRKGSVEGW